MKQLQFIRPGKLEWWDVPAPTIQSDTDALVRPLAVARCDLDAAILWGEAPFKGPLLHFLRNHLPDSVGQNGIFKRAPFKGPYPFGHEFVGEILETGPEVKHFQPGARVIVPFQISCGTCARCVRGLTNSCLSVPPRSMYGFGDLGGKQWGGALSDAVRVPFADAMFVPVPDKMDLTHLASVGDNVADGYRTVGPLLRQYPGAPVLVVGGGALSVGLYSAAIAVVLGAEKVDYIDSDASRLALARALGANVIPGPPPAKLGPYPITVDASAHPEGLSCALLSTEPGGTCTSVGIYYAPRTPIPLLQMYGAGVTFTTGRVNSRAVLPELMELIAAGTFAPESVTTLVAPWNEADGALLDSSPKVIITRL